MLSFLYVYSDHSILECYNLFSGVELSMRSFLLLFAHWQSGNFSFLKIPILLCILRLIREGYFFDSSGICGDCRNFVSD